MTNRLPHDLARITNNLAHTKDCIQVIDLQGRLLWANRLSNSKLGIEPSDYGTKVHRMWADTGSIEEALANDPPIATHFTASRETDGTTSWWDLAFVPVDGSHERPIGYVVTCHDVTGRVTENVARDILLEEMKHRQGNTLALASTLMTLHAKDRPELDDFVDEMSKRLAAMGRAQAMVAKQDVPDGDVMELSQLLETLVRPLIGPACDLVIDVEPGITLPATRIDVVGMVLSELAVNSAKHGAFVHGGRLALSVVRTDGGIEFSWQERSNAVVAARQRAGGMGQKLMNRIAKINDGDFDVTWRPRGQLARLILRDEAQSISAA